MPKFDRVLQAYYIESCSRRLKVQLRYRPIPRRMGLDRCGRGRWSSRVRAPPYLPRVELCAGERGRDDEHHRLPHSQYDHAVEKDGSVTESGLFDHMFHSVGPRSHSPCLDLQSKKESRPRMRSGVYGTDLGISRCKNPHIHISAPTLANQILAAAGEGHPEKCSPSMNTPHAPGGSSRPSRRPRIHSVRW